MSIKVKPNNIHIHGGWGGNVVYLKLALFTNKLTMRALETYYNC